MLFLREKKNYNYSLLKNNHNPEHIVIDLRKVGQAYQKPLPPLEKLNVVGEQQ